MSPETPGAEQDGRHEEGGRPTQRGRQRRVGGAHLADSGDCGLDPSQ